MEVRQRKPGLGRIAQSYKMEKRWNEVSEVMVNAALNATKQQMEESLSAWCACILQTVPACTAVVSLGPPVRQALLKAVPGVAKKLA
eukprot:43424-Pelagomonas_calceolata.AAC.1